MSPRFDELSKKDVISKTFSTGLIRYKKAHVIFQRRIVDFRTHSDGSSDAVAMPENIRSGRFGLAKIMLEQFDGLGPAIVGRELYILEVSRSHINQPIIKLRWTILADRVFQRQLPNRATAATISFIIIRASDSVGAIPVPGDFERLDKILRQHSGMVLADQLNRNGFHRRNDKSCGSFGPVQNVIQHTPTVAVRNGFGDLQLVTNKRLDGLSGFGILCGKLMKRTEQQILVR